jgi:hypothetical protein
MRSSKVELIGVILRSCNNAEAQLTDRVHVRLWTPRAYQNVCNHTKILSFSWRFY